LKNQSRQVLNLPVTGNFGEIGKNRRKGLTLSKKSIALHVGRTPANPYLRQGRARHGHERLAVLFANIVDGANVASNSLTRWIQWVDAKERIDPLTAKNLEPEQLPGILLMSLPGT
jgi:hypothetical protein